MTRKSLKAKACKILMKGDAVRCEGDEEDIPYIFVSLKNGIATIVEDGTDVADDGVEYEIPMDMVHAVAVEEEETE